MSPGERLSCAPELGPLFERIRLNVSPLYQVLGLTRIVDMSGALKDPSPAEMEQMAGAYYDKDAKLQLVRMNAAQTGF